MTTTTAPPAAPGRDTVARIAAAGLAGALVDFVYATGLGVIGGRGVVKVWQGVAGGWLGRGALKGGLPTFALGLATHVGIALCMATVYWAAASRLPVLYRRPWLSGLVYGALLYGVMYGLVLPLRWPEVFPKWDGLQSVGDIGSHLGVGLAIALVLSPRHAARPPAPV